MKKNKLYIGYLIVCILCDLALAGFLIALSLTLMQEGKTEETIFWGSFIIVPVLWLVASIYLLVRYFKEVICRVGGGLLTKLAAVCFGLALSYIAPTEGKHVVPAVLFGIVAFVSFAVAYNTMLPDDD